MLSPIQTPGKIIAFTPINTLLPILIGSLYDLLEPSFHTSLCIMSSSINKVGDASCPNRYAPVMVQLFPI